MRSDRRQRRALDTPNAPPGPCLLAPSHSPPPHPPLFSHTQNSDARQKADLLRRVYAGFPEPAVALEGAYHNDTECVSAEVGTGKLSMPPDLATAIPVRTASACMHGVGMHVHACMGVHGGCLQGASGGLEGRRQHREHKAEKHKDQHKTHKPNNANQHNTDDGARDPRAVARRVGRPRLAVGRADALFALFEARTRRGAPHGAAFFALHRSSWRLLPLPCCPPPLPRRHRPARRAAAAVATAPPLYSPRPHHPQTAPSRNQTPPTPPPPTTTHAQESWKRRHPPGLISDGNDRVLREVAVAVTDVEGSTELWEWDREVMARALEVHDNVMRDAISRCDGGGE